MLFGEKRAQIRDQKWVFRHGQTSKWLRRRLSDKWKFDLRRSHVYATNMIPDDTLRQYFLSKTVTYLFAFPSFKLLMIFSSLDFLPFPLRNRFLSQKTLHHLNLRGGISFPPLLHFVVRTIRTMSYVTVFSCSFQFSHSISTRVSPFRLLRHSDKNILSYSWNLKTLHCFRNSMDRWAKFSSGHCYDGQTDDDRVCPQRFQAVSPDKDQRNYQYDYRNPRRTPGVITTQTNCLYMSAVLMLAKTNAALNQTTPKGKYCTLHSETRYRETNENLNAL